jgi:hypothetical protein
MARLPTGASVRCCTFETCRPALKTSVHRGGPEVIVGRQTDANDPNSDIGQNLTLHGCARRPLPDGV